MVGAKGKEQQNHCHFPILLGFFQGGGARNDSIKKRMKGGIGWGFVLGERCGRGGGGVGRLAFCIGIFFEKRSEFIQQGHSYFL